MAFSNNLDDVQLLKVQNLNKGTIYQGDAGKKCIINGTDIYNNYTMLDGSESYKHYYIDPYLDFRTRIVKLTTGLNRYIRNEEVYPSNIDNKLNYFDGFQRFYVKVGNSENSFPSWTINQNYINPINFANHDFSTNNKTYCSYKFINLTGLGGGTSGSSYDVTSYPYFVKPITGYPLDIIGGYNHKLKGVIIYPYVSSVRLIRASISNNQGYYKILSSSSNPSIMHKSSLLSGYENSYLELKDNNVIVNNYHQSLCAQTLLEDILENPDNYFNYTTEPVTLSKRTSSNSGAATADLNGIAHSIQETTTQYYYQPFVFYMNYGWAKGSLLHCVVDFLTYNKLLKTVWNNQNEGSEFEGETFDSSYNIGHYCTYQGESGRYILGNYDYLRKLYQSDENIDYPPSTFNFVNMFNSFSWTNNCPNLKKGNIILSIGGYKYPGIVNNHVSYNSSYTEFSEYYYINDIGSDLRHYINSYFNGLNLNKDNKPPFEYHLRRMSGLADVTYEGGIYGTSPIDISTDANGNANAIILTYSVWATIDDINTAFDTVASGGARFMWFKSEDNTDNTYIRLYNTDSAGGLLIDLFHVLIFPSMCSDLSNILGRTEFFHVDELTGTTQNDPTFHEGNGHLCMFRSSQDLSSPISYLNSLSFLTFTS